MDVKNNPHSSSPPPLIHAEFPRSSDKAGSATSSPAMSLTLQHAYEDQFSSQLIPEVQLENDYQFEIGYSEDPNSSSAPEITLALFSPRDNASLAQVCSAGREDRSQQMLDLTSHGSANLVSPHYRKVICLLIQCDSGSYVSHIKTFFRRVEFSWFPSAILTAIL